jgi:hypothetical protein
LTDCPIQRIVAVDGLSVDGLSVNALSVNALSVDALSVDGLSVVGLSVNGLSLYHLVSSYSVKAQRSLSIRRKCLLLGKFGENFQHVLI